MGQILGFEFHPFYCCWRSFTVSGESLEWALLDLCQKLFSIRAKALNSTWKLHLPPSHVVRTDASQEGNKIY